MIAFIKNTILYNQIADPAQSLPVKNDVPKNNHDGSTLNIGKSATQPPW